MEFLFGLADRISVVHWGQVIAAGTPEALKQNPWVQASNLGGCNDRRGRPAPLRAAVAGGAEALLACEGIDTFYGETQALFDVSLAVGAGEVVALLGAERRRQDDDAALDPRPDAGRSAAASASTARDVTRLRRRTRSRARGIGWVPDDRRILPDADRRASNLSIAQKQTRFRPWSLKETLRDLLAARLPDAARVREPLRRRDADGRDLARPPRRARAGALRRAEPGPRARRSSTT